MKMLTMSINRYNVKDVIEIIEDIKSKLTFLEKNLSDVEEEQIEQSLRTIDMSLNS